MRRQCSTNEWWRRLKTAFIVACLREVLSILSSVWQEHLIEHLRNKPAAAVDQHLALLCLCRTPAVQAFAQTYGRTLCRSCHLRQSRLDEMERGEEDEQLLPPQRMNHLHVLSRCVLRWVCRQLCKILQVRHGQQKSLEPLELAVRRGTFALYPA